MALCVVAGAGRAGGANEHVTGATGPRQLDGERGEKHVNGAGPDVFGEGLGAGEQGAGQGDLDVPAPPRRLGCRRGDYRQHEGCGVRHALLPPDLVPLVGIRRRVVPAEGNPGIDPGVVVEGGLVAEAHVLATQGAGQGPGQ